MMSLWDLKAGLYHAARRLPLIRTFLDQETWNLKELLDEADLHPDRVLDIGIGSGSTWSIFQKHVTGVGVDRSHAMLAQARKRVPRLHPVVADVEHLPIRKQSMLFIAVIGLAEYIQDKNGLLDQISPLIQSGGWLLVTIPTVRVWNRLRNLLGSPLFMIREAQWEMLIIKHRLGIVGKKRSQLQIQYLLQRKP